MLRHLVILDGQSSTSAEPLNHTVADSCFMCCNGSSHLLSTVFLLPQPSLKNKEFLHWICLLNRPNDFSLSFLLCVERPVLSHPHLVMTLTVITSVLDPSHTHFDCKSRWSCFCSSAQSILELIGVTERVRNGFWNSSVSMTICKKPCSANAVWLRPVNIIKLWPVE